MPPKGKQATKGQKQIVEENKDTLKFYVILILAVNVIYLLLQYFLFWEHFTTLPIMMFVLCLMIYSGSYYFMSYMARATYGPGGNLIDGGLDLNMTGGGMAEHAKDLILFSSIVEILSIFHKYFWLGLFVIPAYAFYMLWVNLLAPWIFAPAPEIDEKKQRKMERKMKRH